MSIEQAGVVDAIGVDVATGEVVLTISDHLGWDDINNHLFLLQEKVNAYLRFVEAGELLDKYPKAKGLSVLIDAVCKYPPSPRAKPFYEKVASIVESAGMHFRYRIFVDQ